MTTPTLPVTQTAPGTCRPAWKASIRSVRTLSIAEWYYTHPAQRIKSHNPPHTRKQRTAADNMLPSRQ